MAVLVVYHTHDLSQRRCAHGSINYDNGSTNVKNCGSDTKVGNFAHIVTCPEIILLLHFTSTVVASLKIRKRLIMKKIASASLL